MKNQPNALEDALLQNDDGLSFFLESVSVDDFRKLVAEMIAHNQSPEITNLKAKVIEFLQTA